MIVYLTIASYIAMCIYDAMQNDESVEELVKCTNADVENTTIEEKEIWDHALLLMNGIGRPIEECELIEVKLTDADCPQKWERVKYSGTSSNRSYEIIDISEVKLLEGGK